MTSVYIDIAPILESQWTGIPVFTRRLILALQSNPLIEIRYCLELHEIPRAFVENTLMLQSGTMLRSELIEAESHVLTLCDPAVPVMYPSAKHIGVPKGRTASTIHDMSTLVMPENHEKANVDHHLENIVEELATNDAVFCVSNSTKNALETAYPSVKNKTKIIYQYVDWPAEYAAMDANAPKIDIGRYALVIGTLEPRKNLQILLRILDSDWVKKNDLKFVVIGKKGWRIDSFLSGVSPEQRRRIIFTGYVSEFIKYRLLRCCVCLVFPSIYEGFGIPAVEAMSLEKPIVASRASCFPEVIEGGGVYFDPYNPDELVQALKEVSHDKNHIILAKAARERSRYFTPQRMAAPVVEWLTG